MVIPSNEPIHTDRASPRDRRRPRGSARSAGAFGQHGVILFLEGILAYQGILHDAFTDWYDFEDSGAFNPNRQTGANMEGWIA